MVKAQHHASPMELSPVVLLLVRHVLLALVGLRHVADEVPRRGIGPNTAGMQWILLVGFLGLQQISFQIRLTKGIKGTAKLFLHLLIKLVKWNP